jgi:uncharacterized protein with HEPN domain
MQHDHAYLLDILKASRKIIRVTTGLQRDQFDRDDVIQDSVIRQIEIIGEAAAKVSKEFKADNTNIAWREMVGMRNRLIHDYSEIDLAQVWKTVREDIPKLIRLIEPLVPPEE